MHGSSIRGRSYTLSTTSDPGSPPGRAGGIRARLRRNAVTRIPYLVAVALAGTAVIALGVVLLPLPGPGWVVIFVGIGIWASEFRWAARLLIWVRGQVRAWARWLGRRGVVTRTVVGLGLAAVALAAVAACYVALRGVPPWLPDWVPLAD
jgi:uncharacterized protein (TIGR02611 family)